LARRPWPPERPSHPPEATGGLPAAVPGGSESLREILSMPPHGRRANSTVPPSCPALAGTVASGQSPIPSGKRRLSEPPGGRRWPPEGGPASLEAMGGGVHDGIRALPDLIGLCPLATVPARAGHRGGHGGIGSPPVRGHRQNFTKALQAAGRLPVASGGWLGLSGGHGRRGARRNRGVARRNWALPARDRARKGWERRNWLVARAGASSEFYEGSPSRRGRREAACRRATPLFRRAPRRPWRPERPSHPPEATGGLPAARRAFVKF